MVAGRCADDSCGADLMPDPLYSDRWTQLFTVTPSIGPITGPNLPQRVAPAGPINWISGFMVNATGTITIEPKESPEIITLAVVAGTKYDIACKRVIALTGATVVWGAR
jgi:hypothetical protein